MENFIVNSFIEKYGNETFNEIKNIIKSEIDTNNKNIDYNDKYIQYLFEFAAYEYCGIEFNKIELMINKMGNPYVPNIPINELYKIHKNSIQKIQEYLKKGEINIV